MSCNDSKYKDCLGSTFDFNIGFIGGGNMSTAIGQLIIKKGLIPSHRVWVSGPHIENLEHWKKLGAETTTKNGEIIANCKVIFLGVKPHLLHEAITGAVETLPKNCDDSNKLFVSVLAGTTIKTLRAAIPFKNCRIIRVMPNTPMTVGEGATVFTPDSTVTEEDCRIIESILDCSGIYKQVDENMINAMGAMAGSGPAFVFLMIEALSDGGVKQGIPRAVATRFAAQTVLGAAKMVLDSGKHPGQLKDEVCSPGGTSICGVHELEKGGVRAAYINAVQAAVERTRALELLND